MDIDLKDNLYRMMENYSRKPIRFKILPNRNSTEKQHR